MRFVLCQGPGEDACSAELARALAGGEHTVDPTVGFTPVLGPDDWLHLPGEAALQQTEARQVLGLMASAPAAVSAHLVLDGFAAQDPDEHWPALEELLYTIGDVGGLLITRDVDLRWMCADPQLDVAETAHDWDESFGLALCVVAEGTGASAVKSDGRRVEAFGTAAVHAPAELGRFVAGFLRGYVSDPADLSGALSMGLG